MSSVVVCAMVLAREQVRCPFLFSFVHFLIAILKDSILYSSRTLLCFCFVNNADLSRAFAWFHRAAHAEHVNAMYEVGTHYLNSSSSSSTFSASLSSSSSSSSSSTPTSSSSSSHSSSSSSISAAEHPAHNAGGGGGGSRGNRDVAAALRWLTAAAEGGHTGAMCRLARCLLGGRGHGTLEEDARNAYEWCGSPVRVYA